MSSKINFEQIAAGALPESVGVQVMRIMGQYSQFASITAVGDFQTVLRHDAPAGHQIYAAVAEVTARPEEAPKSIIAGRMSGRTVRDGSTTGGIFVVDALADGEFAGHGVISYGIDAQEPLAKDKPMVLGIETYPSSFHPHGIERRRQGYGGYRYLAMNAASMLVYGSPLHSREDRPGFLSDDAIKRWKHLVGMGAAEAFVDHDAHGNAFERYRFK